MATVTTDNKKSSNFAARCRVTGLYLTDADSHFNVICISYKPELALPLADEEAASRACALLRSFYGSFDWQPAQL